MEAPKKYKYYKCIHDKRKTRCKDCGGSELCIHERLKNTCKECGGKSICEHGNYKPNCKDCGGSQICEHNISRYYCKDCGGKGICEHKKFKAQCKECKGNRICEHGLYQPYCKDCGGSHICKHKKQKQTCKECDGSDLCKSSWCEVRRRKDLDNYCFFCYIHVNPDSEITKNYRTKEKSVVDFIIKEFPDFEWINNKPIIDGCSKKRPDLVCDFGEKVLIIEIDENQHKYYDTSCESARLMHIFEDIGHRPLIMIKFNPDRFINEKGENIKSCWKVEKNGILNNINVKEWENRLSFLKERIQYYISTEITKSVNTEYLFFDSESNI